MPQIQSIQLDLQTGDMEDAGTDGDVYLGVCGREFFVDTDANDFERGSSRSYIFGDNANVNYQPVNEPRDQLLLAENLEHFPVYIRFEPKDRDRDDYWNLQRAVVTFNGNFFPMWDTASYIQKDIGIWLGIRAGLYVHIPKHTDDG